MEVTYLIIIALVTYILGAITKVKIDKIPNKYIPLQNARFLRNLTFSNGNSDLWGTGIRTTAIRNKVFINCQYDDIITTVQNTQYGAYEYNGNYAVSVSPRDIYTGELIPCNPILDTIILDGSVKSSGAFMYQVKEFLVAEDEETPNCHVLIVQFRIISKVAISNYALRISHNAEMVVNY